MKNHTSLKLLALASALVLGTAAARADSTLPADNAAGAATENLGLLGQSYTSLSYSYTNLDNSSVHGDSYNFEFNQPLSFGFDGFLGYSYSQSSVFGGSRLKSNIVDAGLRAFSTRYNWGKPYVEAGVGYSWNRYAGAKDNAFMWEVGAGVEFQVAPKATVTPYIQYVDVPEIDSGHGWNFGVKGNYWVTSRWAATLGAELDDDHNSTFTIGTNFRF